MKHACYCVTEHNAPLQRMDCPTPEPRGAEVLIRMTGAGVCHSDIHIWEGVYDLGSGGKMTLKDRGVALPLTMGHEISGEVVKAGPDAKAVKPGMSCVVYPWLGCGECPTCKRGEWQICCSVRSSSGGAGRPCYCLNATHCPFPTDEVVEDCTTARAAVCETGEPVERCR